MAVFYKQVLIHCNSVLFLTHLHGNALLQSGKTTILKSCTMLLLDATCKARLQKNKILLGTDFIVS